MINITNQILRFRKFLLDSWNALEHIMKNHDRCEDLHLIDDWTQVNWELLVEWQLLRGKGLLPLYEKFSKRFLKNYNEQAEATHLIVCKSRAQQVLFDRIKNAPIPKDEIVIFLHFSQTYTQSGIIQPPFEGVVSIIGSWRRNYEDQKFMLPLDKIDFYICKIDEIDKEKFDPRVPWLPEK